jgi:eukaryotic-like serine/threonine-protein kinase
VNLHPRENPTNDNTILTPVSPDAGSSSLPHEGDVLAGKYEIEHVVGEGGMCVVYAARHLQLQQRVAIKVLRRQESHQREAEERFAREGRAAIRIRSEYCVRILDVGEIPGGEPYIVMEHLEGSDLEALISANGPLPVMPAIDYVLQASEAIAEAHTLGIVHRDLKPANLFFTRRADGSPLIKVLDFGISKVAGHRPSKRDVRLTGAEMVMGSPQYMSPEQQRATRDVDSRTDIWSLGTILHELLSGEPPFQGDNVTAVCASVIADHPPALSKTRDDVPAGLENVVRRCLQKDPALRFATMAELALALSDYASPAGRASVQRIVGIMQSASAGAEGGILAHANEKPAWGTTDSSWRTEAQKRRSLAVRIGGFVALAAIAAMVVAGGVLYAGRTAPSLPATTKAQEPIAAVEAAPAPPAPAPPLPAPEPAPIAIPTEKPPPPPARFPAPVRFPAPAPAAPPAPAPAPYISPIAADDPPSLALPPPPTAAPAATPASPDRLFDERK